LTVPLVIAHRGASVERPENTLSAFRRAMELGADGVELDVQASADARLVGMHDVTLDRTTSGSGSVATSRSADIKRLDAGSWFGAEHAGEPVPSSRTFCSSPQSGSRFS
jgi:glycerophosphoryl diester phosphodiesterase